MAGAAPARSPHLARFARDRRGLAAIEFAIVGAPFMLMIFAVIQLALYFMVQVTLDNATALAGRQLRTGQIVADGSSDTAGQQAFMTAVCNNMSWLQSQCQGGVGASGATQYLTVDVRTLGAFSSSPSSSPTINSSGAAATDGSACFYSGSAGSAVELRTYYRWPLITPVLATSLQSFANGVAILQSTEVFQVEPNGQSNSGSKTC